MQALALEDYCHPHHHHMQQFHQDQGQDDVYSAVIVVIQHPHKVSACHDVSIQISSEI